MLRLLMLVIRCLLLITLAAPAWPREADPRQPLKRIAFGSCAKQDQPQPIWDQIVRTQPDLFLFIGDNIYADTEDMEVMRTKYAKLGAVPGFQRLRKICPILATWDDHDFGVNDGGWEYPKRVESQQVFLDFFREPPDSPRRKQEGVYDSRVFGPEGKKTQIVLLDTRYFRSPLKRGEPGERMKYVPNPDPSATILGEAQWRWLERQLKIPAQIRIIVSSIQVVTEDYHSEKWANFPLEREKLYRLIKDAQASGVIFISGDTHWAELSMMDGSVGYPLYDLTSSSLNAAFKKWRPYEPNRHRVGTMNWGDNFGVIDISWQSADPRISLQIRDDEGDINIQRKIYLSTIQPGVIP
ncbi:MAG: alkaline phosphatase family protein [Acidimicrobiia bacterium]|nr:alkaline phosphatase family protein [Acidimicrobiia bacterium]